MTAKEYLGQARHLDQRMQMMVSEVAELHRTAGYISAIRYDGVHVQTSENAEASFTQALENAWEQEEKAADGLALLFRLKTQMEEVIEAVPDITERTVLRYRYLLGFTWEQIAERFNANERTIRRWHASALRHVSVPEDPIKIY